MIARVSWLAVTAAIVFPAAAAAQAWPQPAGSGSVGVSAQIINNTGHLLTDGSLIPDGKSRSAALALDFDYAISDRVGVAVGLPFVMTRYIGPGETPIAFRDVDRCRCWHRGWQDISGTVRVNALSGAFALTPSVSVGVPSNDYDYRGEAVIGRNLREVRLAVDAGARLDRLSSRVALTGQYSYAVVERTLDVPNNRSNVRLQGQVAVTRRLGVAGLIGWQRTHGGLRTGLGPPALPWGEVTTELFDDHDRMLRDNSMHVGASAGYARPRFAISASWIEFVRGTDAHRGRAFTVGVSVPFSTR